MRPLPPEIYLPDAGEVLRQASPEGYRQAMEDINKKKGKHSSIRCSSSFGSDTLGLN